MISFITGKPGDGKSLFAVRLLLEEMVKGEKFIVTNLPLRLAYIQEYVSKRRKEAFDIDSRVKVLDDSEVYEFYRHRSGDLVLPWSPDKDLAEQASKRLPRPEFVEVMKQNFGLIREKPEYQKPVVYFIDEAHNFFSARDWATNGRGLLYYASQHRHLHDEIYLITQVLENVEKQLRGLVSETHVVRNQLRRRVGPVKMRPVFRLKSYYGVPTGAAKPFAETTFDLDLVGVASCYNTVGALGVHKTAEHKANKGWLPWWTLPIGGLAAVAIILGLFAGMPILGGKMAASTVGHIVPTGAVQQTPQRQPVAYQPPSVIPSIPRMRIETTPKKYEQEHKESPKPEVYVKGWAARGHKVNVTLSTGEVVTEELEEVGRIHRNAVKVRGQWIPIKREEEKGAGENPQIGGAVADRTRQTGSANEKQSGAISP